MTHRMAGYKLRGRSNTLSRHALEAQRKMTTKGKDSVTLDKFNSTANLADNPGFQSTISVASANGPIEDKKYNPFEHRQIAHPNSFPQVFETVLRRLQQSQTHGCPAPGAPVADVGLGVLLALVFCRLSRRGCLRRFSLTSTNPHRQLSSK
ncbi:hypothetical protein EVAR_47066_1 [Eumeta japonica]|uniref:Uncharacterized protein n=1 Tax=Eumeta variegata TaxID=151549 RepID=A0A4C1WNK1_EUMVA|nr:hypothetical protein EVAR_47066_1 [Eumeta japonica]